jgi:hypothetical protein
MANKKIGFPAEQSAKAGNIAEKQLRARLHIYFSENLWPKMI